MEELDKKTNGFPEKAIEVPKDPPIGTPPNVTNTEELVVEFLSEDGTFLESFERKVGLSSNTISASGSTEKVFKHRVAAADMKLDGITFELKSGGGQQNLSLGQLTGDLKSLRVRLKKASI